MEAHILVENTRSTLLALWVLFLLSRSSPLEAKNSKYNPQTIRDRYVNWLQRHGQNYQDRKEWEYMFGFYQSNVVFIDYMNSQNLTYKLIDNQFADMTEKFRNVTTTKVKFTRNEYKLKDLPAEVDWRELGAITPVTNQGSCGSCWAFSTVTAVEGIHQIKTVELVPLSPQQLVDCNVPANSGCHGGLMERAFEYIVNNGGITTEADYPYSNADGECDESKVKNIAATITGYGTVPPNDENSLLAVVAAQPVAVAIDASVDGIRFYAGEVFSGDCGKDLNHGLTVVGYGVESGQTYWIVKNSWGAEWVRMVI